MAAEQGPEDGRTIPVTTVARIFAEHGQDNGLVAETILFIYDHLSLNQAEYPRLKEQFERGYVSFYDHIKKILDQFVVRWGVDAEMGKLIVALTAARLEQLKDALVEIPESTRLVVEMTKEERKELARRHVPITFQLPKTIGWFLDSRVDGRMVPAFSYIPRRTQERNLYALYYKFMQSEKATALVHVWGSEGVGKSTLVSHFCHLVRDIGCHSTIWLQAQTTQDFMRQLRLLAKVLKLTPANDGDASLVGLLSDVFKNHWEIPILLVLEDVTSDVAYLVHMVLKILDELPPPKAFVIVTSNLKEDLLLLSPTDIQVQPFSRESVMDSTCAPELIQSGLLGDSDRTYKGLDLAFPARLYHFRAATLGHGYNGQTFRNEGGSLEIGNCATIGLDQVLHAEEVHRALQAAARAPDAADRGFPNHTIVTLILLTFLLPFRRGSYEVLNDIFFLLFLKSRSPQRGFCGCNVPEILSTVVDWEVAMEFNRSAEAGGLLQGATSLLEQLGLVHNHLVVLKENVYTLPPFAFERYTELHSAIRRCMIEALRPHKTRVESVIRDFCSVFSQLPATTQEYMCAHKSQILVHTEGFDHHLRVVLEMGPMKASQAYALRTASYILGAAVASIVMLLSSGDNCRGPGGSAIKCSGAYQAIAFPLLLLAFVLCALTVLCRVHSPMKIAKWAIYLEPKLRIPIYFVDGIGVLITVATMSVLASTRLVSWPALALAALIIALIVTYMTTTPKKSGEVVKGAWKSWVFLPQ